MAITRYLRKVCLDADVYAFCIQHALTTEKQEVMGLLIGEVDDENGISYISAFKILHCSVRESDRVEISPEQLCEGADYAEHLAKRLNRPMRVLGWYHSHPHITVWPSHVDVRTQSMYQTMDPLFIGLIFSVYPGDAKAIGNQVQMICFQAEGVGPDLTRREVELVIKGSPLEQHNLEALANLPRIMVQEELVKNEEEAGDSQDTSDAQDVLEVLDKDARKTISLCNIISKIDIPMYEAMEARLEANENRIQELKKIKEQLIEELES